MAMNCEAFSENIDAYIDGGLESAARLEMERHAENCGPCMKLLEEAKALKEMLAEMSEVDVPLPAQAAWRRAVREEARTKRKPSAWTKSIASAAAALVVLVAGTIGMRLDGDVPASNDGIILLAAETGYQENFQQEAGAGVQPLGYVTGALQSDGSVGKRSGSLQDSEAAAVQPVVLRRAERSVETENYDSDMQWLNDLVIEYGAYFEERSEAAAGSDSTAGRISRAVVRVPSERLDDFLMELDQLGRTVLRSEAAEDVTGRYMDTQSRLDALKMQKEKLTEMLAESTNVEELIAIDDKLTEVIASMESLEGDLRRWESKQSYSSVALTLTEKLQPKTEEPVSVGERMKQGFNESVEWLKEFGQDALVTLATYGPRLLIFLPVPVLLIAAVCLIRRRKR